MKKTDRNILQLSEAGRAVLAEHAKMLNFIRRLAKQGDEEVDEDDEDDDAGDMMNPADINIEAIELYDEMGCDL